MDEARERILSEITPLPPEEVPILDALGRTLAEEVRSDVDIPPFDNSAMDGYAVRAADVEIATAEAPVVLEVLEDVAAGYVATNRVGEGQAIRIMTGAPLPEGADGIVMVEFTERTGSGVNIFKGVRKGESVRYAGEDVREGEVVLAQGKLLKPGDIGMLASTGRAAVRVFRQPRVAILSTGDELVDVGEPLAPGKIRNSNAYSLAAQALEVSAIPVILGIARDRRDDLVEKLEKGLEADILITSGGVSVGDYDLVKQVLAEQGEMLLWKVAMKPGKPLAFGIVKGKPLFGLPGYPTSSMISFDQFVRPAILKMGGRKDLLRPEIEAILDERITKKQGRRYFLRGILERRDGELHAKLAGSQKSGALKSMTLADALLVIGEEVTLVEPGERVTAQLLYGLP
ncbi:MAG: molybdopterin molybdotransferase MoeA [Actinobacteria bacterium]|nr:molybdopterin molybdotransferase MoeA [Actinomycetota bacterium]